MAKNKNCTLAGLYGALQARAQIDDGPIFNRSNINNSSLKAQLGFVRALNKAQDKRMNLSVKEFSGVDDLKNFVQMMRTPEALVPKSVWSRVDKKMTQWDAYYRRTHLPKIQQIEKKYQARAESVSKSKGVKDKESRYLHLESKKKEELSPLIKEAEKSYREMVGGSFKEAKQQIQDLYNDHAGNPKRLEAELKKLGGMDREGAYYAHQYLSYLENGGPFYDFSHNAGSQAGKFSIETVISNATGHKISFDPKQVLYNTSEILQKAPAVAGWKNTTLGIKDALAAAKKEGKTLFEVLKEPERAGTYHNDYTPLRPEGRYDTTAATQRMLDNVAYYIGKRSGNVQKALTGIAYRPKPWNDTFGMMTGMKSQFSFMSFQMRHMQQYGGWLKLAASGDKSAARALLNYSLVTGVLFGGRAAIPAPVYWVAKMADPKLDQHYKDTFGDIPVVGGLLNTGLVGQGTDFVINNGLEALTGANPEIKTDMTKYAQPMGGVAMGIGSDIVQGAADAATRTVPKTVKELTEGRYDRAGAALVNGLVQASQVHKNGANAFIQKTIDAITKAYLEDEFTPEGLAKYTGQKYLGRDAVK